MAYTPHSNGHPPSVHERTRPGGGDASQDKNSSSSSLLGTSPLSPSCIIDSVLCAALEINNSDRYFVLLQQYKFIASLHPETVTVEMALLYSAVHNTVL